MHILSSSYRTCIYFYSFHPSIHPSIPSSTHICIHATHALHVQTLVDEYQDRLLDMAIGVMDTPAMDALGVVLDRVCMFVCVFVCMYVCMYARQHMHVRTQAPTYLNHEARQGIITAAITDPSIHPPTHPPTHAGLRGREPERRGGRPGQQRGLPLGPLDGRRDLHLADRLGRELRVQAQAPRRWCRRGRRGGGGSSGGGAQDDGGGGGGHLQGRLRGGRAGLPV